MLACNLHLKRSNALQPRNFTSLRLFSALKSRNPQNQGIVDLLQKYKDEEFRKPVPNNFKVHAYNNAMWTVLKIKRPIRSGKDVLTLPGIGPGITSRINEHLYKLYDEGAETDREAYQEVIRQRAIGLFKKIPGIGPAKTRALLDAGCLSLEDLMSPKFSSMLSSKQLLEAKYMSHLAQPVLRKNAEELLEFCREALDQRCELTLVGDYRRGINDLTDIHIMITHPDFVHVPIPTTLLFGETPPPKPTALKGVKRRKRKDEEARSNILHTNFVPVLKRHGLIADTLASNSNSWQGIIRLPGPQGEQGSRQDRIFAVENLDGQFSKLTLHLVPQKSIGSSLLTLTGGSAFEKALRQAAQQKGMMLDEHGLWKWNTIHNGSAHSTEDTASETSRPEAATDAGGEDPISGGYWSLMKSASEEDIFRELEFGFVDPTKRDSSITTGQASNRRTRTIQPP